AVRTFRTYATARTYPVSTPKHPPERQTPQVKRVSTPRICRGVQTQVQRTHRSHQRTPRSTPPQRAGIQESDQLPTALTAALRRPRPTNRCTLIPEERSNRAYRTCNKIGRDEDN